MLNYFKIICKLLKYGKKDIIIESFIDSQSNEQMKANLAAFT